MRLKPGGVALRSSADVPEGIIQGFSESDNVDGASFSKIRDNSIFERVEERANDECLDIGGREYRPRVEVNVPGENQTKKNDER